MKGDDCLRCRYGQIDRLDFCYGNRPVVRLRGQEIETSLLQIFTGSGAFTGTGKKCKKSGIEAEIDDFVEEMRENLKSKLGGDIVIKLN